MKNKTQGFTLIELLIVIAIIGILAAVLIPNLLAARTTAQNRAAQAYGQNIYKAAFAWVADSTGNDYTTLTKTCGSGTTFAAGSYTVPNPGTTVKSCTLAGTANSITVSVTSANDAVFTLP